MNRIEDIVYYDFQGWPEYKMNLREVLMALGGKVEGDTISFDLKDPLMDVYPRILADDGMGYGVDENVIVSVDPDRQEGGITRSTLLITGNVILPSHFISLFPIL